METEFVRHVCDLVGLVCLIGDQLHMAVFRVVEVDGGPCVASLSKTAFEDLHDAVGIGMAMTCQQSSC